MPPPLLLQHQEGSHPPELILVENALLLFTNVEVTISHYVPNVSIKTTLWLRSNTIVQIAISLCLIQFANNNERCFSLIVVTYTLLFTAV